MADFGAQLRAARERKGISLRQIAATTKISVAALERLERNDISRLPGGIFSRAFVRSYAIEVGLDPDETVRQFLEQFGESPGGAQARAAHPAARSPIAAGGSVVPPADTADEVDFESKQRMAAVVLKLVLVSVPIAAAIIYFSSRGSTPQRSVPEAVVPEAAAPPQPGTPENAPPAPRPGAMEAAPPAPPGAVEEEKAPGAQPEPVAPSSAPQPAPAAVAPPVSDDIAAPLRLEIVPTADCWVKLTIDGDVSLSRIIAAGEREAREFSESAVLQVGDAAACAIAINGRPARALGRPKQVREVRITRENYRAFLP